MRVEFLSYLRVEKLPGERWRVLEPFAARVDALPVWTFTVPAGFETDFASVPRAPLAYLAAGNTAHKAAVLHDWLYRDGRHAGGARIARSFADRIFLEAMRAEGVPWWRRSLMYAAVRAFGAAYYDAHGPAGW